MYIPPECGTAKYFLGEIRNHGCTNIVFRLRDKHENPTVITESMDFILSVIEPSIALVIPSLIDNVSIDTNLSEISVKSTTQFVQNENIDVDLDLNRVEYVIPHQFTESETLETETILLNVPIQIMANQSIQSADLDIDLELNKVEYLGPHQFTENEELVMRVDGSEAGGAEGPLFPPSSIKDGGKLISWGGMDKEDRQLCIPFQTPGWIDVPKHIPWGDNEWKDIQYSLPWIAKMHYADDSRNIPWGDLINWADHQVIHNWEAILFFIDVPKKIPWETPEPVEKQFQAPYTVPEPKDTQKEIEWGGRISIDRRVKVPYTVPDFKDNQHNVRWGPRDLTWIQCGPNTRFDKPSCGRNWFRLNEDMTDLTGICRDVVMVLQCDSRTYNPYHYFHTGNRDAFWVKPLDQGDNIPVFGENFYIVENTILVKRLSDDEPIEVTAVSCRIDKGSWLWDFSLTVPTKEMVDLLRPYKSGDETYFRDIEISINQNIFTCRVEAWSENRVFGKDSWTLTGRSPSSELTEPYSVPESFLSNEERQGGELVEYILQNSGWEAQWGYDDNSGTYSDYIDPFIDWLIPAYGYTYTDWAKKAGVQDVIQSIGGFAQTKADCHLPANKKIILNPNYTRDPWLWPLIDPDVSLPEALCKEISRSHIAYPRIDGVVVSGVDQGVIVNATRAGLAGTTYAPMITHTLISSVEAGSERARSVLAKAGIWATHQLNLFSLKVPGSLVDQTARLILPGELVLVTENAQTWKGQASATTISATVSDQGAKDVMQAITVEEYIG